MAIAELQEIVTEIAARLHAIKKKLEEHDERFNKLEIRLSNLESKVNLIQRYSKYEEH